MSEMIYQLPVPSSSFLESIKFSILSGRKCSLEYFYEGEENFSEIFETLIFDGVESFKCTYYKSCSLEMIDAYDKIIEFKNSSWLLDVKSNLLKAKVDTENLKHLGIYFDDGPCYEFICRYFEVLSEERRNYFEDTNKII